MSLIEVNNLSKVYASDGVATQALHSVSFVIQEGEFVAIMGHSGCGKSTLMHILGFLDAQTNGSYVFNGKPNDSYNDQEAAQVRNQEIGFVFQSFNLLPQLSVKDNVGLPLLYSSLPESDWQIRIDQVIEKVGLSSRADFPAIKLSGGEKQRVAIARALINRPKLILADEPTGNLDSKSGENILKLLQELNRQHEQTIIMVTHDHDMAQCAQRIITMKDGLVVNDTDN